MLEVGVSAGASLALRFLPMVATLSAPRLYHAHVGPSKASAKGKDNVCTSTKAAAQEQYRVTLQHNHTLYSNQNWMRCLRLLHCQECSKRPQAAGLSDRVSLPRLQRFLLAKIWFKLSSNAPRFPVLCMRTLHKNLSRLTLRPKQPTRGTPLLRRRLPCAQLA